MNVREKIIDVLETNGIYFDQENDDSDADMREYITDSIQFMSFIVDIEKEFAIEFPDEALVYDNLASLNGFMTLTQSILDGAYSAGDSSTETEKTI